MTALISKLKIMIYTYNSKAMSLPTINFLHATVSGILPEQNFKGQGYYGKNKRSNQSYTMTLDNYNPQPMSLPSINFLHLMISEI